MSAHVTHVDVAVIGMGPGGATIATYLRQAGLTVAAIERERFPRYHVGESLTGTAADVIRELGLEAEMDRIAAQRKPGVKVVGTDARSEFFVPTLRPTWQVRRAEFDEVLFRHALDAGVELHRGTARRVIKEGERVVGVLYEPERGHHEVREIRCKVLVDASGQSGILSKQGVAGRRRVDAFGRQVAVFSQFSQRLVGTTTGSKTVRKVIEVLLIDRFQQHHHRALHYLIFKRRFAYWPLSPVFLLQPHPFHRRGFVSSAVQAPVQFA